MNSSAIKRRARGEVNEADITHFASFDKPELLSFLHSKIPVERSCAQPKNDFLKYKIARCLSGIHDEWTKSFLLEIIQTGSKGLRLEALRSLILLKIEMPGNIQNAFSVEMQKLESFLKKKLTKKQADAEKRKAYLGVGAKGNDQ